MTHDDPLPDSPEVCAARAVDPAWLAEQAAKRDASSDRFMAWRTAVGMPVIAKGAGERF